MEPLVKNDPRLPFICSHIRKRLLLDWLRINYEENGKTFGGIVECLYSPCTIEFCDLFWRGDFDRQVEQLIHYHIRCILMEMDKVSRQPELSIGDRNMAVYGAAKHLENVLAGYIKPELVTIV